MMMFYGSPIEVAIASAAMKWLEKSVSIEHEKKPDKSEAELEYEKAINGLLDYINRSRKEGEKHDPD